MKGNKGRRHTAVQVRFQEEILRCVFYLNWKRYCGVRMLAFS